MKRILQIFLIFILCLQTAACGKDKSTAEEAMVETQLEPQPFIGEVTQIPAVEKTYPDYTEKIIISEVMPKNKTTSVENRLDDWVELLNLSDETVSLDGWQMGCSELLDLSGMQITGGERLIIFSDDSTVIKDDSVLSLIDPVGRIVSEAEIPVMDENVSLEFNGEGVFAISKYPTPGFENSKAGYCDYQETLIPQGDIVISEVVVYNVSTSLRPGAPPQKVDWVEIRNISDKKVDISEYCLSDQISEPERFRFPKKELKPGEYTTVICAGENASGSNLAHFSLDSGNEILILSKGGVIEDSISLKDIPYGCSYGRLENEAGFFYFADPSYGKKNLNGCRYVTDSPSASIPGGQYTDDDSITVELEGSGTIYYTLDSSEPTASSKIYSGPIEIDKTTVLRAFSCDDGQMRSRSVTYNYILNTEHDLPIVCINSNITREFGRIYATSDRVNEILGNISYYDENGSFSENCTITMNGGTSLQLPKKSMIVRFRGACGCSMLEYPLFDDGVNEFNALVLRVGQDYYNAVVRNELCQTMAMQFSDNILAQRGKWCVVYINGAYYGVYALKENDNAYLYAHRYGVSKDSITVLKANVQPGSAIYQALNFIISHDMSDPANYSKACEMVDMNSMVDWIIAEGYSANPDLVNGNLKYAVSTEDDGKIRLIFYDLDTSLSRPGFSFTNIFNPVIKNQICYISNSLIKNSDFRDLLIRRTSDALHGAFSDENALAIIDEMVAELDSEMERDTVRWRVGGVNYKLWQRKVTELRSFVDGYHTTVINSLKALLKLTDEEVEMYFGDLD